jgi:2-polyprenyl-3-methyl-5-hydroxy-6-metoxy-1,4-benzoquinol methylase
MTSNEFSSKSFTEANETYLSSLGQDYGNYVLGKNTSRILYEDPKLLLFTLSRYKFVMKMLKGSSSILEVGCQEGFGANLIIGETTEYIGIDFYKPYIEYAKKNIKKPNTKFIAHDLLDGPVLRQSTDSKFESAFALDVLEHILPDSEDLFLSNLLSSIHSKKGKLIVGMPTLESQLYASTASKLGHVNCKKAEDLQTLMAKYFQFTFVFSMNDEVLHTGFYPMSHYVFVVGAGPQER